MLQQLTLDHQWSIRLVSLLIAVLASGLAALALRTRPPQPADTARHRRRRTTVRQHAYTPRHKVRYIARHEAEAHGTPVTLGHLVDGDITLVHADQPAEPARAADLADEATVDGLPALIGATA